MKVSRVAAFLVAMLLVNALVARPAHAGSGLPYAISIPVILAAALLLALIVEGSDEVDVRKPRKPRSSTTGEENGWVPRQLARSLPCGPGNGETIPLACW